MTLSVDMPDIAAHPGMRLMDATAAMIRGERITTTPADVLGGAFLDLETPMALESDAAGRALERIAGLEALDDRGRQAARGAARQLNEILALPDPLREAAFEAIDAGRRWRLLGLGIRSLRLPLGGGGETQLLRIDPGMGVARHDHEGDEFTLVVSGGFHDGHGHFGPGEVNIGRPGFLHEPVADRDAACFALAVSFGGARFKGPIGLLQRLTGF